MFTRRSFLKVTGKTTAATMLAGKAHTLAAQTEVPAQTSANDHIQIALIGAGGQGQGDTRRYPGFMLYSEPTIVDLEVLAGGVGGGY